MKITRISVQNYRSLKDVNVEIDVYTAFVGANGSGKSSVLYALEWFFSGYLLESSDINGVAAAAVPEPDETDENVEQPAVTVTVTFADLSDMDRARLLEYGRGETATFSRTWKRGDNKSKVVGNALAGPGFAAIRLMTRLTDIRPAYRTLTSELDGLPDLGSSPSKDQVVQALANWESDSAHADQLEFINGAEAYHMFGINGPNVIRECIRFVHIPAAIDIASQVGDGGRGSALNELIGTIMANAGATARAAWLVENAERIEAGNDSVRRSVEQSTVLQATRINSRLRDFIPNAEVLFEPTIPDWSPKGEATVSTTVSIDGTANDVARQGHGVQRAVMIAMFQALVPDAVLTTNTHRPLQEETDEQAQARLDDELAKLPCLVVSIEEPEIYQHPIRARSLARVLSTLASQVNVQVVLATHSPYFIRPEQFSSLRRFTLLGGESTTRRTTIADVAQSANCDEDKVLKIVEKRLPTTFAEGFFADTAVLVEGDTDKIVIESIAERLGTPLDALGISVLDMSGKEGMAIPFAMLSNLDIPAYILADGDALGAARKHPSDTVKQAESHAGHKRSTDAVCVWLPAATALTGTLPYTFEDPTVVADKYTVWEDDIEEVLSTWPTFMSSLATNGGALRDKNLLNYRTAVLYADMSELPAELKSCIDAIIAFRSH